MAQKTFNINATEVVEFTNELEKLKKWDFPVAVRETLNSAAVDMKIKTVPEEYFDSFIIRKKSFINIATYFKRSPRIFDITKMQSEFGLTKVGQGLSDQEFGNLINNRTYIPLSAARVGESPNKLVSKKFYIENIKNRVQLKNIPKTAGNTQPLIRAAFAAKKGGFLIYDDKLYEVKHVQNTPKLFIKLNAIYDYKENRSVQLKAVPFIARAAAITEKKMPEFFRMHAKERIQKYYSKFGFK